MTVSSVSTFSELDLPDYLMKAIDRLGYERPSPIQAETIPPLLEGRDVVGQAQTGTGKTAAFALPAVARLNIKKREPQVLVLTPTRELAIQVAEAFARYAAQLSGFRVLPVYGGQDYQPQIRALERGVHVIVGTPGRVMDHIRRRTLKLKSLETLVLDEADEMLRMGFIDDVEWVLEQAPDERQMALFSATMPQPIRRIASKYLTDPAEITIKVKTTTAETIRQSYWPVRGPQKLDALIRILEAEIFDAMLVFVRTKNATTDVAERLTARGFAATALNGDIPQAMREKVIGQLKKKSIDIIVATDVAARGLDVERISHVINYDVPHDTESYVHRIGRTGRAGRQGDAILFITPREKYFLKTIEKATSQSIALLELPSNDEINQRRINRFKESVIEQMKGGEKERLKTIVKSIEEESGASMLDIATALAGMAPGSAPLLLEPQATPKRSRQRDSRDRDSDADRPQKRTAKSYEQRAAQRKTDTRATKKSVSKKDQVPAGMVRYRIAVGKKDDVSAADVAQTIEEASGLEHQFIGRIDIGKDSSEVDLPKGMPKTVFKELRKTWMAGKNLDISHLSRRDARDVKSKPDADEVPRSRSKSEKKKKPKKKKVSRKKAAKPKPPRKKKVA